MKQENHRTEQADSVATNTKQEKENIRMAVTTEGREA
jgi:hypothetical protein